MTGLRARAVRRVVRRVVLFVARLRVVLPAPAFVRRFGAVNGGLRRPELLMPALLNGLYPDPFYRLKGRM
jgi:hypothetical protein